MKKGMNLKLNPPLKVKFDMGGGRTITMQSNGRKRSVIDEGEVLVNADLVTKSGHKMDAILAFDEWSSGEHCGTYIMIENPQTKKRHLVMQGDEDFQKLLKECYGGEVEFFPYRYKYRAMLDCDDHHVGEDGWSR